MHPCEPDACPWADSVACLAAQALPAGERRAVASHLRACGACRDEFERLRAMLERYAAWPADLLLPASSLRDRLAARLAAESGQPSESPPDSRWRMPPWRTLAPGVEGRLLASDARRRRVSMLLRLAPGATCPPPIHADVEELHQLDGELWIDARRLRPGDHCRGAPAPQDEHVRSATGCTCLLVTHSRDMLP